MLVLSREVDQWIDIGNDISICVTKIAGKRVKIGVLAPDTVRVRRRELGDDEGGDDE